MIIKGHSSTGRGLGSYLLQAKNERVEVWGIRGDLSRDLGETLEDWRNDAGGTNCKKPLYHAQLNPDRALSREEWEQAITLFEKEMGFADQPRAIVMHEYKGREHVHLVYSRLDEDGKAISDSWNYLHHEKAAREIETELGLEKTQGVLYQAKDKTRPERTPDEKAIRQGDRTKQDPKAVKAELTELYRVAEGNAAAFLDSLKQHGYILATGDKRGFVVLDESGGVHSLTRATGAKAGELKQMLKDCGDLPSVEEVRQTLDQIEAEAVEPPPAGPEEIGETYWRQRIEAERANGDADPPAGPQGIDQGESHNVEAEAEPRPSIFDDSLVKAYEEQIREEGAISQHGLIGKWYEQAADWVVEIKEEILTTVKDSIENSWQDYIKDRERERWNSPDKDDIDLDR